MKNRNLPTKTFVCSILSLALTISVSAFAGPNDGGGGQGLVCRDPLNKKKIISVELLDLWEAREIYKRKIPTSNESVQALVDQGIQRLKNVVHVPWRYQNEDKSFTTSQEAIVRKLTELSKLFFENYKNVERYKNKRLTKTNDAFEELVPDEENCDIEQIVRYKDVGIGGEVNVMINQTLYEKMDNVNQAALILHEIYYALLREFGETTSIRVRRAVGYVMAGGEFEALESLLSKPRINCEGQKPDNTRIYFVDNGKGGVIMVPVKLNGMLVSGFTRKQVSQVISVENYYEQMLNRQAGFATGGNGSPTDFDLVLETQSWSWNEEGFKAFTRANATIAVTIKKSASGVTSSRLALSCWLTKN